MTVRFVAPKRCHKALHLHHQACDYAGMQTISWSALAWCLVPIFLTGAIYLHWLGSVKELAIASSRMVLQLIAVGYLLVLIFAEPSLPISLLVLSVMFSVAAWISIRPVKHHPAILVPAAIALSLSVALHLAISLKLVIQIDPWYLPQVMIPLAGMYFANSMTSISLTAERYFSELDNHGDQVLAQANAFKTAMIPQINGLLAVGLVALPGMMTGQILSGVSPLIAVRYQIMIMAMLLGACAVASALFLWQLRRNAKADIVQPESA